MEEILKMMSNLVKAKSNISEKKFVKRNSLRFANTEADPVLICFSSPTLKARESFHFIARQ